MKKKNLFRRTYRLGTLCTLSGVLVLAACTKDATAELSADGPVREPYTVYMQGGLTYESGKLGIMMAVSAMLDRQ